jgi:hypothetical protein
VSDIINGVKVTKLKSYKARSKKNASPFSRNCGHCLSPLIIDSSGLQQCSGTRLQLWHNDFITYQRLNDVQKVAFLKTISEIDRFEELFQRWNYIDEQGNRSNFTCDYTNNLFLPIAKLKTTMPDPIVVSRIERSIGRKLTDLELSGDDVIYKKGNSFFLNFRKDRTIARIPVVTFPDEC